MANGIGGRRAYPIIGAIAVLILAIVGIMAITKEDSKVTIGYAQVGACNNEVSSSGVTGAGEGAAYVIFHVDTIRNTGSGAKPFHFVPGAMFVVNVDTRPHTDVHLQRFGSFQAVELDVPAGAVRVVNGYVAAIVPGFATTDPSAEAVQVNYFLSVDPTGVPGQTVLFTKRNSSPPGPWGVGRPNCAFVPLTF